MPKTLEEIHSQYSEWRPNEDEFDYLFKESKIKAAAFSCIMQPLHPLERMIVIAWMMALYADEFFGNEEGLDELIDIAKDMMSDLQSKDEHAAEPAAKAGANT